MLKFFFLLYLLISVIINNRFPIRIKTIINCIQKQQIIEERYFQLTINNQINEEYQAFSEVLEAAIKEAKNNPILLKKYQQLEVNWDRQYAFNINKRYCFNDYVLLSVFLILFFLTIYNIWQLFKKKTIIKSLKNKHQKVLLKKQNEEINNEFSAKVLDEILTKDDNDLFENSSEEIKEIFNIITRKNELSTLRKKLQINILKQPQAQNTENKLKLINDFNKKKILFKNLFFKDEEILVKINNNNLNKKNEQKNDVKISNNEKKDEIIIKNKKQNNDDEIKKKISLIFWLIFVIFLISNYLFDGYRCLINTFMISFFKKDIIKVASFIYMKPNNYFYVDDGFEINGYYRLSFLLSLQNFWHLIQIFVDILIIIFLIFLSCTLKKSFFYYQNFFFILKIMLIFRLFSFIYYLRPSWQRKMAKLRFLCLKQIPVLTVGF